MPFHNNKGGAQILHGQRLTYSSAAATEMKKIPDHHQLRRALIQNERLQQYTTVLSFSYHIIPFNHLALCYIRNSITELNRIYRKFHPETSINNNNNN